MFDAESAPSPGHLAYSAAERLRSGIEAACGHPIQLRINDNSSTLIALRFPAGQPPRLSLHRMFLRADSGVVKALGQYVRRPTPATRRVLREFMNSRNDDIRPSRSRIHLRSRGAVYDLHELAQQVNRELFDGRIQARITWSRGRIPHRGRRHIQFGCYDGKLQVIRIHPALDRAEVPEFFVRFVIFHEMLHAELEPRASADGRRCIHSAEFRRRERAHPDYAAASAWEKEFIRTF